MGEADNGGDGEEDEEVAEDVDPPEEVNIILLLRPRGICLKKDRIRKEHSF